jgi:predicted Zn-dependent protease
MDKFGPMTDTNKLAYADMASSAGRFSLAIDALAPEFEKNEVDSALANRLVYAQIRAGRYSDARKTMARHTRRGAPDAYGYALSAVIENWFGDEAAANSAEREALLNDPTDMGVRTAQAFLALRRGNPAAFASITTGLAQSAGASPITNYYLTALNYRQGNYSNADATFQTALLDGNWDEAIRLGQAAVAAGPEYGAAHYALAGAYFGANKNPEGIRQMTEAAKHDKYLDGIRAPKPEESWRYFYRYGRTPLLAPPTTSAG